MSYLLSDAKFWTAVAFIIFIIAIFKPVKKILIENLDKKIAEIKKAISEAENIKEEAKNLHSKIKMQLKNLDSDIKEIQNNSLLRIDLAKKEIEEKFEIKIKRNTEITEQKIKQLEIETTNEIRNKAIGLTIEATRNIVSAKLDNNNKELLLEDSLKELGSALKN